MKDNEPFPIIIGYDGGVKHLWGSSRQTVIGNLLAFRTQSFRCYSPYIVLLVQLAILAIEQQEAVAFFVVDYGLL